MKTTKNYFGKDFSKQFDNYTLRDIIKRKTLLEEYLELGYQSDCDSVNKFDDIYPICPIVRPNRFMWHLSRASCRESIRNSGLLPGCEQKNGIWAHNNIIPIAWFYPMAWDGVFFGYDYRSYDYWRIDNAKAKVEWRIDPYMNSLQSKYTAEEWNSKSRYLCTMDSVPPEALKLFKFAKDDDWHTPENLPDYTIFDLVPNYD